MSDMGNTDTRIQALMEKQNEIHIIQEQRLTQVETRMQTLEIKFPYMENAINKLTVIAEQQTRQGALTEAAVVALKDGQELHSKNIEDIKKEQVELGHMHTTLKSRLDTLWRVLGTVGTAITIAGAGYVFSILTQHHP